MRDDDIPRVQWTTKAKAQESGPGTSAERVHETEPDETTKAETQVPGRSQTPTRVRDGPTTVAQTKPRAETGKSEKRDKAAT